MFKPIKYSTYTFKQYFEPKDEEHTRYDSFKELYDEIMGEYGVDVETFIPENFLKRMFTLLLRRYANSPLETKSYSQWNYRFIGVILDYGQEWVKDSQIQEYLKTLDLDNEEIVRGGKQLYNRAEHDATSPEHSLDTELPYINSQTSSYYKRSKVEGIVNLSALINSNYNNEFIDKFKRLFSYINDSDDPTIFVTEEEDE